MIRSALRGRTLCNFLITPITLLAFQLYDDQSLVSHPITYLNVYDLSNKILEYHLKRLQDVML